MINIAIATAIFLEEIDRFIGSNHLFKRSVLLIKTWCLNDCKAHCGKSILGSKDGMFSSYSLSGEFLWLEATIIVRD
eukprot:gene17268-22802_t